MAFGEREPIDKILREEVRHKFGGHCAYCGHLLGKSFHVDHVIPFAAGGPDDIMNFYPACKHCNTIKNSYSIEQFRANLEGQTIRSIMIVAERFGMIKIIAPVKIQFWYEKQGYVFPEELVKAMMHGKA
jgi:hypothetical protein